MPSHAIAIFTRRARPKRDGRRHRYLVLALSLLIVLVGVIVVAAVLYRQPGQRTTPASAVLIVTSVPSNVGVLVDGKQRGRTPVRLAVAPGDHRLTFQGSHIVPATADVGAVTNQTDESQLARQRDLAILPTTSSARLLLPNTTAGTVTAHVSLSY